MRKEAPAAGDVSVNGGLVGGTGTISGAVTINSTGTLAAGASIGTVTTGTVTLNDDAAFGVEINTTEETVDLLVVNGDLVLDTDNTATFSLTDLGGNEAITLGTTFTVIDYSGSWNGGTFAGLADDAQFALGVNGYQISYNGMDGSTSAVTLTVVPVPEPTVGALIGLSLAGWLVRRRRE
jgi:hypothetical protein